jgi:hypothetical protein
MLCLAALKSWYECIKRLPPTHSPKNFNETDPKCGFAQGFAIQTVGPLPIAFARQMMVAKGAWGWGMRQLMMDYNHWGAIALLDEILPWADNRVEIAEEKDRNGIPVAKVIFNHESKVANYLRQTADTWNSNIDQWTYATGTELAHRVGVVGYYVRLAPPEIIKTGSLLNISLKLKNQPTDNATLPASAIVSPDALGLVRYGLRAANDPRIVNTVKVIDAMLKTEVSTGPVWHRYTMDGYGETSDGGPFRSEGIGSGWPLLGGERAHYELAHGNLAEARRLRDVMVKQSSQGCADP